MKDGKMLKIREKKKGSEGTKEMGRGVDLNRKKKESGRKGKRRVF